MIEEITEENIQVKTNHNLCVVDFWASWCGPCKIMAPIMEQLSQKFSTSIHFGKVNVDEQANIAKELNIMSIPTLVIYHNGQPVEKVTGLFTKEQLSKYLEKKILKYEAK